MMSLQMQNGKNFGSNKALILLSFLGLFLLSAIIIFYISSVTAHSLSKVSLTSIAFDAELVSAVFWLIFLFIGGFFWAHTFFRTNTIVETISISLSIGLSALAAFVFSSQLLNTLQPRETFAFTIMAFSAFTFVGLLFLITREVVVVTFFSKK